MLSFKRTARVSNLAQTSSKLSNEHIAALQEASESIELDSLRAIAHSALYITSREELFTQLGLATLCHAALITITLLSLSYLITDSSALFLWSSEKSQEELSKVADALQIISKTTKAHPQGYSFGLRYLSSYRALKQQLKLLKEILSCLEVWPVQIKNPSKEDLRQLLYSYKERQRQVTFDSDNHDPSISSTISFFNNADSLTFSGNTTMTAVALTLNAQTVYNINFTL
ncbi:hypothetical protein CPB83DRAFT_880671, partial [Crepidotus variabilis]